MGGRGSGGRRVGSGRKPKDAHLRAIQGGRSRLPGAPPAPPSTAVATLEAIEPPADLEPDELAVWMREAPRALKERTLTESTTGAFRELCELEALKDAMFKKIRARLLCVDVTTDVVVERAHPLLTHYRGAVQRLAAFRKDFKLAPFGKELLAPEQPKANPLSRFTG